MDKEVILIIDDDPNLRKTLADIFRVKGYKTLAAGSGAEGLALMEETQANLVLIDLGLPDMSGMEVLACIKTDHPSTEVIILTGNATFDSAVEAANKDAFSYLIKPYDMEQLLLQIRRAMEKQRAEDALRKSEERFRRIFELGPLGMYVLGIDHEFIKVNRMFCAMTGYAEEELAGLKCEDITHPEDIDMDLQNAQRLLRGDLAFCVREKRYVRKNREILWANMTVSLIRGDEGTPNYFLGMIEDISEKKLYQERLDYQSNHDGLTGLPNLSLLHDRTCQAVSMAHRHRHGLAVLFVDLDHFKYINESLGHDLGDTLLKIVAERLTDCVRSGDTVARQGGDDFVILLSELAKSEDATTAVRRVQEALAVPFKLGGHEIGVTCSIGISVYPKDGEDVPTLLRNAELAMYRAKDEGRDGFQFFTGLMNAMAVERVTMEKHLRRALERNEFLLHYQPRVDLRTGYVSGCEALIRWLNPELGLLPPGRFISLAEETGLIVPIGEWVLRTACAQGKEWLDAGLPQVPLAVNLSPRQFWREDLPELVARVLQETGLDPYCLELEIVESMLMRDAEKATTMLHRLHEIGVRLAMDDFGTGYSSLGYLKRFPLERLKIDRCFVSDITTDPDSAAIVRTIISMARNLKLLVIAEGVETLGQLNFLRTNGCDEMQGFYVSPAVPSEKFEQILREDRRLLPPVISCVEKGRTLLIVDDEVNVIRTLQRVLNEEGYHILTAANAAEGFDVLADNRVGVILADELMPGMRGSEFLMRVKELYPDTMRLVLTAYADLHSVIETINKGGVFKFLTKPFDNDQLRRDIREAFAFHELAYGKGGRFEYDDLAGSIPVEEV